MQEFRKEGKSKVGNVPKTATTKQNSAGRAAGHGFVIVVGRSIEPFDGRMKNLADEVMLKSSRNR